MSNNRFERLFSPLQVGPMRVANRICETTNSIGASATGGFLDDRFIEHHAAKARGGTGWIGSETWLLNSPLPPEAQDEFHAGAGALRVSLYQMPGFADGVARFCDEIHRAGAVAVFQLTHLNNALAASSVPIVEAYDYVPHELSAEQIEFILQTYADAAALARDAGADGIEIHCAHETTPQSFLSPALNRRRDRWGGGPKERIRFVVEALERVRARVGHSLAVGIRINGQESRQGGYEHLEMREMTYYLGETGLLDFVDVDVGHCWGSHAYVPPSYYGTAEHREVGKAARADLDPKIAVLFSGRINEPVLAEELLREGCCDLVGMTRAGIADPEFPRKAREGRLIEMRRCIGCNRCISEAVHSKVPDLVRRPICSVNPVVGNELRWKAEYRPAERPKRVLVVGGGVAGLEAARVAALRGHRVTVLERGWRIGGQLLIAAKAPGRDSFTDQVYYEENELARLGVDLRLETEADGAAIEALAPEVVVIATGSTPRRPLDIPGCDLPHVVQGWDVLAGRVTAGARVAVVSQEDYFETPNVAEYLAEQGKRVEIFHKSTHLGADIDRYSMGAVLGRLERHGVVIRPNLRLAAVEAGALEFVSAFGPQRYRYEGFDTVVLVYGSVPQSSLYDELLARRSIPEVYVAGSAWVPRRIAEATQHGASIGLVI